MLNSLFSIYRLRVQSTLAKMEQNAFHCTSTTATSVSVLWGLREKIVKQVSSNTNNNVHENY